VSNSSYRPHCVDARLRSRRLCESRDPDIDGTEVLGETFEEPRGTRGYKKSLPDSYSVTESSTSMKAILISSRPSIIFREGEPHDGQRGW